MHQLWHKADLSIPLGSLFGDERTLASCKSYGLVREPRSLRQWT